MDKGWVKAKDLGVGDILTLANGEETKVEALEIEEFKNPVKVYNFEVEDWHTYFVSSLVYWCIIYALRGRVWF